MIFHWIVLDLYAYDLHKNAEKPGVISFLSQIFCQKAVPCCFYLFNLQKKKSDQYLGPRRKGVIDHQFHKIAMTKRSLTL